MQIKGWGLVMVISCIGTALAMAVPEQGEDASSNVVGAVEKLHSADFQEPRSDIHFDLSTVRRHGPDKIRTSGLFKSKSWYVPPPPPPAPPSISLLTPSQPSAPQLPFTFIGRMMDGNEVTLFLVRGDRTYTVKANDVLDDTYRVDQITRDDALLTYLPLNTQQKLEFHAVAAGNPTLSASVPNTMMPLSFSSQRPQQPSALLPAR